MRQAPHSLHGVSEAAPQPQRRRRLVGLLLAVLIGLYILVWVYRFFISTLGPFAPLALAVLFGALLAIVGPWLIVRYWQQLLNLLVQAGQWLWHHTGLERLAAQLQARYPRLARFLIARFTHGTATGLGLTIGLVIAGVVAGLFLEVLIEIVSGGLITGADHRIINLIATLRTPALDQVMLAITYLGNVRTVIVLAAVAIGIALLARRYEAAALIPLSLLASTLFFATIKLVVARPRPLLEDARIIQSGFSFPSGHAAVSATFYGTLAYLLMRASKRETVKILVGLCAALLVFLIGLSRIYLGVHYPSDVVAGWIAGLFWLVLVAVAEHVYSQRFPRTQAPPRRGLFWGGSVLVTTLGLGYLIQQYQSLPLPPAPTLPQPPLRVIASDAVPSITSQLPTHTETLTGKKQEPISLIVVGTQDQLEHAFRQAGWTEAQTVSIASVSEVIRVSLRHQADPAGPVTPSFVAEQPNTLAFNLPVGTTFEQRHHVRIWRTHIQTKDGQLLWEATASFDKGFELGPTTFLPTHQIAPDIDNDRDYVATSLEQAGTVGKTMTIQFVPPEFGYNLAGDVFFTYGKAIILWLQ
jgi:membrane-associated phospholipid phosphatase